MKSLAAFCLVALTASSLDAQDASVEQAVDAINQKLSDAWTAADAAGIAALFAEDGDQVGFGGVSSKGRAAIAERYEGTMASYQGSSLKLTRTSLHVVAPDVLVADGTWEIAGGTSSGGGPTKGFYTFVLAKQAESWTIVSNRVKAPPAN